MAQVHGLRALGFQEIVEKPVVADLIIGVVVNVLSHIAVEDLEGGRVQRVSAVNS